MIVKQNTQVRSQCQVFVEVCFSILYALNFVLIAEMSNICPMWCIKEHRYKQDLVPLSRSKSACDHLLIHAFTLFMLAFYRRW